MNVLNKLKETAISVLPVMAIVLLLGFTVVPLDKFLLIRFIIGGILLIIGLTIFLVGIDLGIQPMGERCGAELTKKRSLPLLLGCAFLIGLIVTAAEPDIQVFGIQVRGIFDFVNKNIFTFVIAGGVGIFITIGLVRIVFSLSIKWTFFIFYVLLFGIMIFCPDSFIGIAFDSGGATTGPMTVPFIMALGLGVSSVRSDSNNSFGLTGICSVGPVMAVLIYSLILKMTGCFDNMTVAEAASAAECISGGSVMQQIFGPFGNVALEVLRDSVISILPLFCLFLLFQFTLLKMTALQVARVVIGFIYSFVGLAIFLIGVNGGFTQVGSKLGSYLGTMAMNQGGFWFVLLIVIGIIFGAVIVCAEPAVGIK